MTAPRLAIDPFDEAFLGDPHAHHTARRDAGPVVARMEAEAVLGALIPRDAEIRAAGSVVPRFNNTLRAFASIPVELVPA